MYTVSNPLTATYSNPRPCFQTQLHGGCHDNSPWLADWSTTCLYCLSLPSKVNAELSWVPPTSAFTASSYAFFDLSLHPFFLPPFISPSPNTVSSTSRGMSKDLSDTLFRFHLMSSLRLFIAAVYGWFCLWLSHVNSHSAWHADRNIDIWPF